MAQHLAHPGAWDGVACLSQEIENPWLGDGPDSSVQVCGDLQLPYKNLEELYKELSYGFCACSGVLKITVYCVQELGTVHQTADRCTPSDSQAHSLIHQTSPIPKE